MGHWDHRIVRRKVVEFGKEVNWFGIHECFYGLPAEEGEEPQSVHWTNDPVAVEGETVEQLRQTLERMLRALDRPIIDGTNPGSAR